MDTKKILIGIVALVIMFLGYCKYKGKNPKDVINGFFKGGETTPASGTDAGNANVGTPTEEATEADLYLPQYRISATNSVSGSVTGSWNYALLTTKYAGGGTKSKTFTGLRTTKTRIDQLVAACDELAQEIRRCPTDFKQDLISRFEAMSAAEIRFCWHYIHQAGWVMTDRNGDEYILESISEIADDPLQNNRVNAAGWIGIIEQYRDYDDEL